MRKVVATAAILLLTSMSSSTNKTFIEKYNIPTPVECKDASYAPFEFYIDPNNERFFLKNYQTKCNGVSDLRTLSSLTNENPIIYMLDRNKDGKDDEFYFDKDKDGVNGNEYKCSNLDECISMAIRENQRNRKEMLIDTRNNEIFSV